MKKKLSIILLASLMSLNVFSIPIKVLHKAQKTGSSWDTIECQARDVSSGDIGLISYLYGAANSYLYGAGSDFFNYFSKGKIQAYEYLTKKLFDQGSEVLTITKNELEETEKLVRKEFDKKIVEAGGGAKQYIFDFFGKLKNRLVGEQPNAKDEKAKNPKTVKNTSIATGQTLTNKINEDTGYDSSILGASLLPPLSGIAYFALKYYK